MAKYVDPYSGMVFDDMYYPDNYNMQLPAVVQRAKATNPNVVDATFKELPNNNLKGWFTGLGKNSGWNLTGNSKFGIGNTNGKAGLTIGGKNLAPYANVGVGLYQGINAIKGLNDISKNENDRQALLSKIRASASGNPMLSSYLTSDQMSQLNKLRRGYNDNSPSGNLDFGSLLGGAGKGALMGAAGGLPGMIIGAIGGGVNAGINSKNQAIANDTQSLESLYQALMDAESQYKSMKIPNYTGLGLQSRYTNQWR